jgi:uncharacterized protein with PIN domain
MRGGGGIKETKFIVDHNVGKLARWLRMMGFDSLFFDGDNDSDMVRRALAEGRVILTRDTEIMERRVVRNGRLKAILIASEVPETQMRQLLASLDLKPHFRPFTRCLECNELLVEKTRKEVENKVPPYVFKTQTQYMECPACRRIYWRGTHWEAMIKKLELLADYKDDYYEEVSR